MPENIQTDARLLSRLMRSSGIDRETLLRQRISFIYGALPPESTITKRQIEDALRKVDGEQAA